MPKDVLMSSAPNSQMCPESLELMQAIGRYIERNDVRGVGLPHAASDVLDGLVVRCEVNDLVRRKLLRIVNLDGVAAGPDELCGSKPWFGTNWTVELTQRAIEMYWPDRAIAGMALN